MESTERTLSRGGGGSPVDQLLARGLLVARDRRHVAVPREVAICLRDGRTTGNPGRPRARARHVRAGRGRRGPGRGRCRLRAGPARRAAARALGDGAARRPCGPAGWGCVTSRPPPSCCTPTSAPRRCTWRSRSPPTWSPPAPPATATRCGCPPRPSTSGARRRSRTAGRRLALAWLDCPRLVGLVGGREAGKPVNALVPDLERMWLPETRRAALEQVAAPRAGHRPRRRHRGALAGGADGLAAPAAPLGAAQAVAWVTEEAAVVGVTALGGMSVHGRALLSLDDPQHHAPAALGPLLPEPIDHVLLQADLTAVAPGPLEQDLARHLSVRRRHRVPGRRDRLPVHRGVGPAGVRLRLVLRGGARVPGRLVADPGAAGAVLPRRRRLRRFGTIRVGAAESFLRSDDEAALTELVHHPKAAGLRLRRIAPTVVVSDVPLDVLLPRLRELGSAPSSRRPTAPCAWPGARRCGPGPSRRRPGRATLALPGPLDPTARPGSRPGGLHGDRGPGRRPGGGEPAGPRPAGRRAHHAGLDAGRPAGVGGDRDRSGSGTSTTTGRPSSGSSTRSRSRRAGCRPTTTAPRTCGRSRCTGSPPYVASTNSGESLTPGAFDGRIVRSARGGRTDDARCAVTAAVSGDVPVSVQVVVARQPIVDLDQEVVGSSCSTGRNATTRPRSAASR